MAGDDLLLSQLSPKSASHRNDSIKHSIISRDEQQVAHFGKRQRFRVCNLNIWRICLRANGSNSEISTCFLYWDLVAHSVRNLPESESPRKVIDDSIVLTWESVLASVSRSKPFLTGSISDRFSGLQFSSTLPHQRRPYWYYCRIPGRDGRRSNASAGNG